MNCAVIVDSRPIDISIVEAHMKYLKGWDLHICIQPISLYVKKHFDCRASICPPIKNLHDYNNLLTSINFWETFVDYDRVLIFQQDSMLLRDGIEEFLEWDYIGASIKNFKGCMNGGLSLRNPKKMIECINRGLPHPEHNEDIRFCHALRKYGGHLPDEETASKFSVETVFKLGSLGMHAANKYLSNIEYQKVITQYD